jgi:signal transduction histidine kinase
VIAVSASPSESARETRRPHILIIDDDDINLDLLRTQLGLDEYIVTCARGGTAGLAAARKNPPDLVVSDVVMPDIGGYDVVRQLKTADETRAVPVLLVTSTNERSEKIHGLAAGADDFLARPIDTAELLARVRSLLRSKSLYDQLQALNLELEQRVADRTAQLSATVRELETFAYSVSHDLRAPLRGMDGFSQALLEDFSENLDPTAIDYLRRVRAASQRMGQMIDDLLRLSRLSRGLMRTEAVDISALARTVACELPRIEPGRAVMFSIQSGLTARGDSGLLRLVYQNLLENAWKFTRQRYVGQICVGAEAQDGGVAYFVRDNGVGFDMSYAQKLFGVFQRLHDASEFEGNGIGLATVQRIVHRHAGRAWAEGAPDRGSTFWFTLNGPESANSYA